MTDRVWHVSAGPATVPLPVLEPIRDEPLALPGVGASVLEGVRALREPAAAFRIGHG